MSVTIQGRLVSINATGYTSVDLSFEDIYLTQIIVLGQSLAYSNVINIDYNIIRPNINVLPAIIQDTEFNIINTSDTNTGSIQITLTTGSENIYFNGIETFTKPTIPGTFTVNFTNSSGILTFS